MKKKIVKQNTSGAVKIGLIGAGVASMAAAYFFLGPKGKKHQKNTKAWAIKMKGEVVEKLETAKEISEPIYQALVDSVSEEYKKGMKAGSEEIDELAVDLKKHWKTISGSAKTAKKDVVRSAKKIAKTAGV